jgi:CDP-diacylglycerol--glycerol-3-phosphate 3-phosphatidyltransferase
VADGALARKFKVTSSLGSLLDSIADVVLTVVVLVIARAIVNPPLSLIAWLFVILAIRLISLLIAWLRFHKTMFLHTTGNRVFGWLFFFYPFTLFLTTEFWIPVILCILATLAAFEEVLIMRAAPEFDPDIRSLRSLLAKRAHHT